MARASRFALILAVLLAGCAGGNHRASYTPNKNLQVGSLSHCQKVVGADLFRRFPLTAYNRSVVDGYCKAAKPTDSALVVSLAAQKDARR